MEFRLATPKDALALANCRKAQLIDEDLYVDTNVDDAMLAYFEKALFDGTLVHWVCEDLGEIVSTGGVIFQQYPPSFKNPTGVKAYIANVYTKPEYRGQGLALKIVNLLLDESRKYNLKQVWLEGSKEGQFVYKKCGFDFVQNHMKLLL